MPGSTSAIARDGNIYDDNFLLLLNAHHEAIDFTLPALDGDGYWYALLDTAVAAGLEPRGRHAAGEVYPLAGPLTGPARTVAARGRAQATERNHAPA